MDGAEGGAVRFVMARPFGESPGLGEPSNNAPGYFGQRPLVACLSRACLRITLEVPMVRPPRPRSRYEICRRAKNQCPNAGSEPRVLRSSDIEGHRRSIVTWRDSSDETR